MSDGAIVSASTFGEGDAGNVSVIARDIVFSAPGGGIGSEVGQDGKGEGGSIFVITEALTVDSGATISASTFGEGDAADVLVIAQDILLSGTTPDGAPSGIGSQVGPSGKGEGGNVSITTNTLTVSNGASVSASTFGEGDAGDVSVVATQQILIDGAALDRGFPSSISTASAVSSRAGDINITTPRLRIDNQGVISTASNASDGGNIFLNSNEALLMRRSSAVSTTAGSNQNPGNGGNITINTPFLISLPNENSDIVANAFEGTGGNITINSDAILSFELQDQPNVQILRGNNTNDISASSAIGSNGILNLAGLNVDPARGSAQLPVVPAPPNQVDRTCSAQTTSQNKFTVTGRGGMPLPPSEHFPASLSLSQWVALPEEQEAKEVEFSDMQPRDLFQLLPQFSRVPVEVSGWRKQPNGSVTLIAQSVFPNSSVIQCAEWMKQSQDTSASHW